MTKDQFEEFNELLKAESDKKYYELIEREKETCSDDPRQKAFYGMLEGSKFFKDLYYRGLVQGIDMAKKGLV